jgi:tetratricopeptide (TPR) repeat protein
MKMNFTRKGPALAALISLLGTASVMAETGAPTGFVMNYYEDTAQGALVEDGAYEAVINRLAMRSTDSARRVADQINLCVAYTKTKQIDKATVSCDLALARAGKKVSRQSLLESYRTARERADAERAIALINRGVLHAVNGETEEARELFELAADLETRNESAEMNLLVLQRELAEKDS